AQNHAIYAKIPAPIVTWNSAAHVLKVISDQEIPRPSITANGARQTDAMLIDQNVADQGFAPTEYFAPATAPAENVMHEPSTRRSPIRVTSADEPPPFVVI